MLTIREALELPAFENTALIAGESGIENFIKWVTTIEIIEDISRFQSGELVITTGYGLTDSDAYKDRFLQLIKEKKLAGLAVYTGFYMADIPDMFIQAANEHELPLIEIPASINFSTLTKAVLEQLVNTQTSRLKHSLFVHKQLTKMAMNQHGLPDTLKQAAPLTKASLFVFDGRFNHMASAVQKSHENKMNCDRDSLILNGETVPLDELFQLFEEAAGEPLFKQDYVCLLSPVQNDDVVYGYLLSCHYYNDWSEMDAVVIEHISTLIGIEMVKKYAVDEAEVRIHGELADQLLHKEHLHYQETVKRGERLGYDLTRPHAAVYMKMARPSFDTVRSDKPGGKLYDHARSQFTSAGRQVILLPKTDELYCLIEMPSTDKNSEKELLQLLENIHASWLEQNSGELSIGTGRPYNNLTFFSESAREAENSVYYASLLLNKSNIVAYSDLGFYDVLIQMDLAGISLRNYSEHYLGDLLLGTHVRRDLIHTLETYFANNCNLQQTAARLFIHRHTLKYRLTQIEKKTGCNLQSADARFNLHLACAAYKFTELSSRHPIN